MFKLFNKLPINLDIQNHISAKKENHYNIKFLILIMLFSIVTGCSKSNILTGKWEGCIYIYGYTKRTYTFESNGEGVLQDKGTYSDKSCKIAKSGKIIDKNERNRFTYEIGDVVNTISGLEIKEIVLTVFIGDRENTVFNIFQVDGNKLFFGENNYDGELVLDTNNVYFKNN